MRNKLSGFTAVGFSLLILGSAGTSMLTGQEHNQSPIRPRIENSLASVKSMSSNYLVLGTGEIVDVTKMKEASVVRTACGVSIDLAPSLVLDQALEAEKLAEQQTRQRADDAARLAKKANSVAANQLSRGIAVSQPHHFLPSVEDDTILLFASIFIAALGASSIWLIASRQIKEDVGLERLKRNRKPHRSGHATFTLNREYTPKVLCDRSTLRAGRSAQHLRQKTTGSISRTL